MAQFFVTIDRSLLTEIGGQIGWLGTEISMFFKKPVYYNDTVVCDFTIRSIKNKGYAIADAIFKNQYHQIVLKAVLKGFLPCLESKKIMNRHV